MKFNNIKKLIVLLLMTYCCGQMVAQQTNTLYFMQGIPERGMYNPALQTPYDFYLNLPILPSFGLSVGNNSLVFNDVIFNKDGQTIQPLHPNAGQKRADFFNALHNTTRIHQELYLNILGFGFRKDANYFTFDISLKEQVGMYLPKDLFNLVNGTASQTKFNLHKLGVNFSLYTEIAFGYSRQLNDKWTVGGKLKYLTGAANVSTKFKELELNPNGESWTVSGSGSINASIPDAIIDRGVVFNDNNEIDFDNLGDAIRDPLGSFKAGDFFKNSGVGIDLGATFQVLPELQLSAAVTDLGFIHWGNNTINAGVAKDYTFEGIEYIVGDEQAELEDKFNQELDKLKGIFENENVDGTGKSYSTMLPTRLNIGGEYNFLNNKIGVGLLSSNLFINKGLYSDLTASVNFRPVRWFHPTISYSILDGGFRTIGAGAQLLLGPVNLYLAIDKIPVGPKSFESKYYIPKYMNGTSLHAGMTWVFGDSRKKKCFDIPKGWIVDKYGCPIDTDGDGVADSIDECPNTPMGVEVDAKGCPVDTDGDGVADYLDKCPNTPAGVAVDQDGCPLDTDGDGVPDYLDECLDTPAGVEVDAKGCPFDTDGDSVPDYLDKCPNTPAEAYATIDEHGCPKDTDSDGVFDYLDKCPNTPTGVEVDSVGCPRLREAEVAIFEKALHGIQFATGKATITKASYPILDAIVMIMNENPSYMLNIHGHTDNVGSDASNQKLSEKRAAAVRDYLINKGIVASRMKSEGFGEARPLVPNTTAANRAENRRVEFIVEYEQAVEKN